MSILEDILTAFLLIVASVASVMLSLPVRADCCVLPEVQYYQIDNNPIVNGYNADRAKQIEEQKLQIMQEQARRQDLQRIQEQQFMLNQQSNRRVYE